jgi:hypothetical protein
LNLSSEKPGFKVCLSRAARTATARQKGGKHPPPSRTRSSNWRALSHKLDTAHVFDPNKDFCRNWDIITAILLIFVALVGAVQVESS